jgi:hypothetical protein
VRSRLLLLTEAGENGVTDTLTVVQTDLRKSTVERDALDKFEPHHFWRGQFPIGVPLEDLRAQERSRKAEDVLGDSQQLHLLLEYYI